MPVFEYKAANEEGKHISGSLQAENLQEAKAQLKKDKLFLFKIQSKTDKKQEKLKGLRRKRVDIKTLSNMTRLLATLIKSNVPLVDALTMMSQQMTHPVLGPTLTEVRNQVNEGQAFHKALRQYPGIFNSTYISMCEAGENSGALDLILLKLAEFTENQSDMNNKVRSAMAYPLLIAVFAVGVVLFLFTYVVPKVTKLFEDQNLIPWYTELVISLSQFLLQSYPKLIGLILVGGFLFLRWIKTPSGRYKIDSLYLQIPFIGKIIRSTAISRFSRTLATLLKGGVPMLKSMDIVQNVAQNIILKEAIKNAQSQIREGESIARPLQESGQFPPLTIQMIKTGEKTGELEEMLIKISDTYDFQVNTELEALTSMLAPAMIMIMGGIVGFIVFSVIMPIMEVYNQI